MTKQGVWVSVLVVSALVGLGCGGLMGGKGPGRGAPNPDKLRVGKSSLQKSGSRDQRPTNASLSKRHKKNEYTVKLRPGVKELRFGKKGEVESGDKKLDSLFGSLDLGHAAKVHGNHAPKNQRVAESLGLGRTIHIRSRRSKEEVYRRLEAHPDVEWVEPVVEVQSASVNDPTVNDPYFQYQWHLHNLAIEEAWELSQGEGVVVAVVDTGVSSNEDGFFKLLSGYDFVDNDSKPDDGNGHGTHVAGTIAQATDNGVGVAGVAPKAHILPVRVLDDNGSGSNTWVANGIIWAVDHGANIINLSLGSQVNSDVVSDACDYAYENGVTVIAATGNDGFTDYIGYPAALPSTIAVGSVDTGNKVAFYSNQGKQIDLVGPGGDTTVDGNGDGQVDGVVQETRMGGAWAYHFLQGTSMATPHVSGVAALVYAKGVTEPDAIRDLLNSTASDLGGRGWDSTYGNGLVNPVAALKATGGGGGGNDKPVRRPRDGGGKLAITMSRVKPKSDTRVIVGWMTNEPSTTMIKANDGSFRDKDDNLTKVHKVTVAGKKGDTVTYTIASMVGGERVMDEVTVTF